MSGWCSFSSFVVAPLCKLFGIHFIPNPVTWLEQATINYVLPHSLLIEFTFNMVKLECLQVHDLHCSHMHTLHYVTLNIHAVNQAQAQPPMDIDVTTVQYV